MNRIKIGLLAVFLTMAVSSCGLFESSDDLEEVFQVDSFRPTSIHRLCPDHIHGDREFDGEVKVDISVFARIVGNAIFADVSLRLKEPEPDYSTAEGNWSIEIYTAPQGFEIVSIESDRTSIASYVDNDHTIDHPLISSGILVSNFDVNADTPGNDIGNCTIDDAYLTMHFNTMTIKLKKL